NLADQLIAIGQRGCQLRGLGQKGIDRGPLILKYLDQLAAQRIDLVGIQRLEQWTESADERIEVQRRLRTLRRDGVPRFEWAYAARTFLQLQIAIADQVVVADECSCPIGH